MRYTTKENVEQYLNTTISINIDLFILSAEQYIDTYTGKNFKEGDEKTRYYDGNNKRELIIDDATEITSLYIDDELMTEGDDYLTYPYNKTPIYKLIGENRVFPEDYKNIKVTGKFGYECPPDEIKMVATILTAGLYQATRGGGEISSEKIGDYSVSYTNGQKTDFENVKEILNKYRIIVI
jgi:hypothetical protein